MPRLPAGLAIFLILSACGDSSTETAPESTLDSTALVYVVLELSVDRHAPGHVDAYFGPEALRAEARNAALSLEEIRAEAGNIEERLREMRDRSSDAGEQSRIDGLLARLNAMQTRISMSEGETLPFDEESERLFAATAPDYDAAHFDAILAEIDALIPGRGPLAERVENFRSRFAIPPDRLSEVFDAAIAECRRRTLEHIELPDNESFTLEYVTDKPWSGYNWYQGNAQSLIQINTDLPIFISRAVDLGCHEGYPGHHTFNALLEQHLVHGRRWLEFSLYPLFSPQSLIAEGSGNYGIDVAFPGDERIQFEKDVLFPLAGLDAEDADRYYELLDKLTELDYAGNEAARDYLNGDMDRAAAIDWLVEYTLASPERALQRTQFFDGYRSYVINYNLGRDMVARWVEAGAGDAAGRWERFEELLSTPKLPADLD